MKAPKDKGKQKYNKYISIVISFLIILPLIYLVYVVSFKKTDAPVSKADSLSVNNMSIDSSQIKLQKAIDLAKANPNENSLINLSLEYYQTSKYKECADAASKALKYNPKSYAAYNNICSANNQLGKWDDAIAAGKKALEIVPGDQLATNNLKASIEGKSKLEKSIVDAKSLINSNPNETNYINLGNIYYNAGKFEMAIKSYQKALTYNKKNLLAYNNICSAYNELGEWKLAAENCEKALKIDSTYTLAKNNLKISKKNLSK